MLASHKKVLFLALNFPVGYFLLVDCFVPLLLSLKEFLLVLFHDNLSEQP